MKIEVTAEDIAADKRNNCGECPVALAVRRQSGYKDAEVWPERVRLSAEEYVNLPLDAVAWIRQFDSGELVKPFAFTLDLRKKLRFNVDAKKGIPT